MDHCKIHNVKFYNPEPQAVRCMTIQNSTKALALSRSDATLEIWNLQNAWFVERSIAPTTENFSIEGLAWCGKRLLSVGLHGLLVEYNLNKLRLENRWAVTGEAAFCLDVDKDNSKIAIGTEQGYLNLFTVEEDEIYFKKFFDKQEGRIISIKFNSTGEFVVSGSTDVIRIWNVESGHAIHKMTTGRAETDKPTIVWCIDVTDDFTIISGDSRGKLTFWDGKVGSQIESYQSHKADILSICLSEDQTSLYCSGVDPNIIIYEKITVKEGMQKWIRSIQRKIHEHDVNSMVLMENKLYSGGADSYLVCSYYPPKTLLKVPPLLQNPFIQLAVNARYILLRYSKHIEVWTLGKSGNVDPKFVGSLIVEEEPKKLLELKRVSKNYDGEEDREGIMCSAISNNGTWIFYGTVLGIQLFQFIYDGESPNLIKVDELENRDVPCLQAAFTPDNLQLITYSSDGNIYVYKLLDGRASIHQVIDVKDVFDCVTFLIASYCGKYLIVADPASNILVFSWDKKNDEWIDYCKLPQYKNPPTCMNIHPNTSLLVVVYSDSKIIEYDVDKRQFTRFSRELEHSDWKPRPYPISNIAFDPRSDNIIVQDDGNVILIKKHKKATPKKSKENKTIKTDNMVKDGFDNESATMNLFPMKKGRHLVHFEWLDEDEMVIVELNPLSIIEQLPPAFLQNTFGKK